MVTVGLEPTSATSIGVTRTNGLTALRLFGQVRNSRDSALERESKGLEPTVTIRNRLLAALPFAISLCSLELLPLSSCANQRLRSLNGRLEPLERAPLSLSR